MTARQLRKARAALNAAYLWWLKVELTLKYLDTMEVSLTSSRMRDSFRQYHRILANLRRKNQYCTQLRWRSEELMKWAYTETLLPLVGATLPKEEEVCLRRGVFFEVLPSVCTEDFLNLWKESTHVQPSSCF